MNDGVIKCLLLKDKINKEETRYIFIPTRYIVYFYPAIVEQANCIDWIIFCYT